MEKETVDLDYRTEYKKLQEKFAYEMKAKEGQYRQDLNTAEQKWRGVANTQQEEIDWLKSVINGILHI